jgi:hypothetical protein
MGTIPSDGNLCKPRPLLIPSPSSILVPLGGTSQGKPLVVLHPPIELVASLVNRLNLIEVVGEN